MSTYRVSNLRKRTSGDESSDRDENVPPLKKPKKGRGAEIIKSFLGERCESFLSWFFDGPLINYKPNTMNLQEETTDVHSKIEKTDINLSEDAEEDIEKLIAIEEKKLDAIKDSPKVIPKPVTTSTPLYRDGTMVGFRYNAYNTKGFLGKDFNTIDNLQNSQKPPRSSNRIYAPLSNPGADIEILLDSRDVKDAEDKDIEIVSEAPRVKRGSQFYRPLMSPICVFDGTSEKPTDTSHKSGMNGKEPTPSTSRQNSKVFHYGYTANEVVRLQEKAQYEKLLNKIVNNSAYRPVIKKKVTAVEVDLTKDEEEDSPFGLPFKREYLHEPLEGLLEKRYTPIKLVPKTSSQQEEESSDSEDEETAAKLRPRYKFKNKPDLFSPAWIQELKTVIDAETEKRLLIVSQTESKIKRYQERRDARLKEQRLLFEKYKVPGDVFPETSTDRNDYPDFTPEMENIINNALKQFLGHDTDEMCSLNGVTILRKHVATLDSNNWLIDEILNFYLNLIVERSKLDNYPSVYAYNTFFFSSLKSRGVNSVLRWTRKVDIFSYDILFVPLHLEVHWALCVVDNRSKTIKYYDSMGSSRTDTIVRLIHGYLISEMKAKKNIDMDPDEYTLENVSELPKQMNGSDCGMFTLKYAEYISRDVPITFEQAHITYFRRRMVYEILNKQLM